MATSSARFRGRPAGINGARAILESRDRIYLRVADSAARALAHEPHSALRISELAFFLDVDGTIVEIAPAAHEVVADAALICMLRALAGEVLAEVSQLASGRSSTFAIQAGRCVAVRPSHY